MEVKIIRPTTKPEAIKGKLLKYQGTDYCEFMPQAQGEPQYEGIRPHPDPPKGGWLARRYNLLTIS